MTYLLSHIFLLEAFLGAAHDECQCLEDDPSGEGVDSGTPETASCRTTIRSHGSMADGAGHKHAIPMCAAGSYLDGEGHEAGTGFASGTNPPRYVSFATFWWDNCWTDWIRREEWTNEW